MASRTGKSLLRRVSAFGASSLLMAGAIAAGTATTAGAAVGDPFTCTSAQFFLSQGVDASTQLYQLVEGSDGHVTQTEVGPPTSPNYNALGYNPGDHYLYANFTVPDPETSDRVLTLGRIDSTGATTLIAPFQPADGTTAQPHGVSGTFDDSNHYWLGGVSASALDRIDLATGKSTLHLDIAGGVALGGSDMTWKDGYIWSVQDGGDSVRRVATDGSTILVPISGFQSNDTQGADWTYGNGNLGTSGNESGAITQIHVSNPTSANPTAEVVNVVQGPQSSKNDGASCAPSDVPVGIAKTAPATVAVGGTITWTIQVHNYSTTSSSSGYYFTDNVPANVSDVTAVNGPGSCTAPAAGTTFSCNAGVLAPGATDTFTFTGRAGAAGETITNTASVFADEHNSCETAAGPPNCVTTASATTKTPAPQADLSITKTGPATIDANGTITWSLTVTNNGPAASPDAVVTDAVPAGVTDIAASGCGVGGHNVACNVGPLANGATEQFTVTGTAPSDYSDCIANTASILGELQDPNSDNDHGSWRTCTNGPQLQVTKIAQTVTGDDNAPPGSTVKYTITVTNPGPGVYTAGNPATVSDDMSGVLDDAALDPDSLSATAGKVSMSDGILSWSGTPAIGAPVSITYSVTVHNPDVGDHDLVNAITTINNQPCSAAVACPAALHDYVPDLHVTKVASRANAAPGTTVDYTITVANTGAGDWPAAFPAQVSDDLSEVLDDATLDGAITTSVTQQSATVPDAAYAAPNLTWSGPLAAGDSFTITYSVAIDNPDTGDHDVDNAVVANAGNCLADSTDPSCVAAPKAPDLHITKTASTANAAPGSTVSYQIVVENSGLGAWTEDEPASLADDLTGVLDDASLAGEVTTSATQQGATVPDAVVDSSMIMWSGPLAAGDLFTITYAVTIDDPDVGDHDLTNAVTAATGNCAADTACMTQTLVPDVTVAKTASSTDAAPGTTVDYTIMLTNSGAGDWTDDLPASFTDDLSEVLDDAVWDDDLLTEPDVSAPVYSEPTITWSGPLAAGDSFTITYSVTIDNPDAGDHEMSNLVAATTGNCGPGSTDPACGSSTLIPELHVVKTASATTVGLREKLGYTLTITNPGAGDWTDDLPATVTDDLTDVLDDATYAADASESAGAVSLSGQTLTWTGPLAAGGTVTVSYSVTVTDPDAGNHELVNHVSAPTGNCDPEPDNPDCNTTTPVAAYALIKTSDPASGTTVPSGQRVSYTVTVVNTGEVDLQPTITDDLSNVFDDAADNGDAAVSAGTVKRSAEGLVWIAPLPVGASVTLTYSVTVNDPASGDHDLANVVAGDGPLAACGAGESSCETHNPVPDDPALPVTGLPGLPETLGLSLLFLLLGAALWLGGRRSAHVAGGRR